MCNQRRRTRQGTPRRFKNPGHTKNTKLPRRVPRGALRQTSPQELHCSLVRCEPIPAYPVLWSIFFETKILSTVQDTRSGQLPLWRPFFPAFPLIIKKKGISPRSYGVRNAQDPGSGSAHFVYQGGSCSSVSGFFSGSTPLHRGSWVPQVPLLGDCPPNTGTCSGTKYCRQDAATAGYFMLISQLRSKVSSLCAP